ncbi:DOMON-like domain-containing protein [Microseira wollei]|uniref:DOMON-like domain-containing protein n=1 Tax=Microseira wollei NIES-4236 TaxID=2530354 RepID=A0AAV3XFS2_9CYAN|nr:DOMON-like domain-containing protein [Microseira wollei]GET40715.1 hypothetical protein MiSe_55260 [Microseira wollei NIES-4236]
MMFSLQPFPSNKPLPNLSIAGDIARNSNKIVIRYEVTGDLKEIARASPAVRRIAPPANRPLQKTNSMTGETPIPQELVEQSNTPARQHQLWEETCFEFFLGIKNSPQYWEFNLSPAAQWNVYRFDGYRQGMQEELAFSTLPFRVDNQADSLTLCIDVDLDKIVAEEQLLDVAITTVIKHKNGEITYWALTHRGTEADFHLRESFIIEL